MSAIMSKNDICNAEGCAPAPSSLDANKTFIFFIRIIPSLLAMVCIIIGGIISMFAIIKYRDSAILLFLSALFGLFGIIFVLVEFLVPH